MHKHKDIESSLNDDEQISKKILVERVRLLYQNLKISVPASFICATILFVALYFVDQHHGVWIWYCAIIIVSILRLSQLYFYLKNPINVKWQLGLFMIGAYLNTILWAVTGSWLMPQNNLEYQVIVIAVIAGITAGGLHTLQSSFIVSSSFIFLILFPMLVWLYMQPNSIYLVLGMVVATYLVSMIFLAKRNYDFLIKVLRLQYENADLIEKLSASHKQLEVTNNNLRDSEMRFYSSFKYAVIGMALLTKEGSFTKVNPSLCILAGYNERELIKMNLKNLINFDTQDSDFYLLLSGEIQTYQAEKRLRRNNGDIIWVLMNISSIKVTESNASMYFMAEFQNIDAQRNAEEQLKNIAYHDALTGLANRKLLETSFDVIIKYAQRHHESLALYFMDLDRFKDINDSYGHDIGDLVLKTVADRLLKITRETDIISRIGGDEIILVISEISDIHIVAAVAEKIKSIIAEPMMIHGQELRITISLGISLYPKDGENLATLMTNADKALYFAKLAGRNNYKFYSTSSE